MSALTDALDRILIYLEEHENLDFARFESLQFGLSYEEIIEKTSSLPFCLSREFIELYRWGNGTWEGEELYGRFFSYYVFLSLEAALNLYYRYTSKHHHEDSYLFSEFRWNSCWFPIMEEMDGNGIFTILLNQELIETTPVLDIFWEDFDGEPLIIYPTLTKMIQAEADLYEAGYYLPIKNQEINYEAVKCIRQKYQEIPMRIWREGI